MACVSNQGPATISQPCHTCGIASIKTFTCVQCNCLAFCDSCWSTWVLHVRGGVGWGGKPHEKADPAVIQRLRQVFEPVRTEAEFHTQLIQDRETTWFGFGRDSSGHPVFQDYGRFAAITGSHAGEITDQYPQLVSFIGETGAGKSTLIKLLIDRQDLNGSHGSSYYSPVTSSSNDYIPTTGDVHLYAEPSTFHTNAPLLLVDCEGLNGGEAMPRALRDLSQDENGKGRLTPETPKYSHSSQRDMSKLLQFRHSSQRYITWANSPQTRKREYTVSQLYPRILYLFSDVVVFVIRNTRSFESIGLNKLLQWGAASVEKSINQPVLPHAIIVLNATEDVNDEEWDVTTATNMLMTAIRDAITREPALDEYVQIWRKRGKEIESTEHLLKQYYASVAVIRIPRQGSYTLMEQQAIKFFDLIRTRCAASHLKKKQARMLANTEMLQLYLQASYDHFTRNLESPFDFVREALRHNPVSRSFEGNILHLAVSIRDYANSEVLRGDANKIFQRIAPMIASAIMFDAVRQNILGTATRLLSDAYAELCVSALQNFADLYWPCKFRNPVYRKEHGRCCNVKSGHNPKGHQNEHGKIIGHGKYESNFDIATFIPKWKQLIQDHLANLQSAAYELGQKLPGRTSVQIASIMHRERINNFYDVLGNLSDFISHSACFSCLRELPECSLPCGHVLCISCVKTYGRISSRTTVEIKRCPLHVRDIIADPPWVIATKPLRAGVRVLCLDGGGISGIIELKVLQAIEKLLGSGLPVRLFFDLIVGTSAGGIIALGLGVKGWSVHKTIKEFKAIYKEACTPRKMIGVPLLENLTSFYHGSIYKTQPLEKELRSKFSDQNLFGAIRPQNEIQPRVAVTSTTAIEQQAVIFTNYNRPDPTTEKLPYKFIRPDKPCNEVKIWEAARATSAMSPYFKSFRKLETESQYLDDSFHNDCPIWVAQHEAKLVWSDVANLPPDIMLSVGSGRNVRDKDRSPRPSTDASTAVSMSSTKLVRKPPSFKPTRKVYKKLDDYQKRDQIWDKFMNGLSAEESGRCIRISPELNIPWPKFDDILRIDEIEREAEEVLQQNMPEIRETAHRLVSSVFFFEKDPGSVKQTTFGYTCKGSILCRFQNSSDEMKALGGFLRSHLKGSFEPYFLIEDDIPGSVSHQIVLTETMIRDINQRGYLDIEPKRINALKEHSVTKITLCLQTTPYPSGETTLPISGFPRQMMSEDVFHTTHSYAQSVRGRQSPDLVSNELGSKIVKPTSKLLAQSEVVAELPESPASRAELPAEGFVGDSRCPKPGSGTG